MAPVESRSGLELMRSMRLAKSAGFNASSSTSSAGPRSELLLANPTLLAGDELLLAVPAGVEESLAPRPAGAVKSFAPGAAQQALEDVGLFGRSSPVSPGISPLRDRPGSSPKCRIHDRRPRRCDETTSPATPAPLRD